LIYNLLIIINGKDTREGFAPKYTNQQNLEITKIGQVRLRSLELVQQVLSLMHPTNGALAAAQVALMSD